MGFLLLFTCGPRTEIIKIHVFGKQTCPVLDQIWFLQLEPEPEFMVLTEQTQNSNPRLFIEVKDCATTKVYGKIKEPGASTDCNPHHLEWNI